MKKSIPLSKTRWIKRILWILFLLVVAFYLVFVAVFFLSLPDVEYLKDENPATTALIEQRKKEAEQKGEDFEIRKNWVNFSEIPQALKDAVRVSEDVAFYDHEGIDYFELKESIKRNLEEGKTVRGGSTITQQLAKNLFLSTEKSYFRKIKEFLIAKRLEKHLSKERIFSLYLNIIEMGRGVFGVGAAAQYYYKWPISFLNLEECVRLAAVLPQPLQTNPLSDSRYLKRRCRLILKRLKFYGLITNEQYDLNITKFQD
jgi:monofunctional biosynthetic peptidoglycan transglycosylase